MLTTTGWLRHRIISKPDWWCCCGPYHTGWSVDLLPEVRFEHDWCQKKSLERRCSEENRDYCDHTGFNEIRQDYGYGMSCA